MDVLEKQLNFLQLTSPCTTAMCASYIDGLVQERCNSSANALELHLSCTNLSIMSVVSACPGKSTAKSCDGQYDILPWY